MHVIIHFSWLFQKFFLLFCFAAVTGWLACMSMHMGTVSKDAKEGVRFCWIELRKDVTHHVVLEGQPVCSSLPTHPPIPILSALGCYCGCN